MSFVASNFAGTPPMIEFCGAEATFVSSGTLTGLGHAASGSPSTINPPQTSNTHYSSGIAVGKLGAVTGGNGKLVITY